MRSAVILAGGGGRRLGVDKALLEFDGRALLSWTVRKVRCCVDEVVVVARDRRHAEQLERITPEAVLAWDSVEGFGPVAGLDSGMRSAAGDLVFATGCDLPFLSQAVIERLFELAEQEPVYDAAVPIRQNGWIEPLHSVYSRERMAAACHRALLGGEQSIRSPLRDLRINCIPVEMLLPLDPDLLTFFNLNTQEDLRQAQGIWSRLYR